MHGRHGHEYDGRRSRAPHGAAGGGIYGLGFLGAVIYYIAHADGFWVGVLGVLKALVWPVFLVYGLLAHVNG